VNDETETFTRFVLKNKSFKAGNRLEAIFRLPDKQ